MQEQRNSTAQTSVLSKIKNDKVKYKPAGIEDRVTTDTSDELRCYPNNNVRTVVLEFGKIPVGSVVDKSLKITNGTCTEESYEVNRDPTTNPLDAVFHVNKYSWSLTPGNSEVFQIRYNPPIINEKSIDYFAILNKDRTILKIVTKASCIGPNVSISRNELSIVCSPGGVIKTRITLTNESEVPTNFVFDVDANQSSFKPCPAQGIIDANSNAIIVISFAPKYEGYHVCQLPCLILHQAPILIRAYGYCSKDQNINDPLNRSKTPYPSTVDNSFEAYTFDSTQTRKIQMSDEFRQDHVSLSDNYIDFGGFDLEYSSGRKSCSPQTTCFTNHTLTDLFIKWPDDVDDTFSLSPNSVQVKAGETCLIEVTFSPKEENKFYEREFQALICYEENDNWIPNFYFSVLTSLHVMGHTFRGDSSNWIPEYDVPGIVTMPPCLPLNPVYTTFLIKKFGHLPIMYRFIPPNDTCFTVKPLQGIIDKHFQVIVVEMFPTVNDKLLYERWAIRFNGNPNFETFIDFRGYADYPCLNFEDNFIELPSTFPGCEGAKNVLMLNTSRHHIDYKFVNIPTTLKIHEAKGKIYSNEILTQEWLFCPSSEGHHEFTIFCCYSVSSSASQDNDMIMCTDITAAGKCKKTFLVAIPNKLLSNEHIYNEPGILFFELFNPGNVEIFYSLTAKFDDLANSKKIKGTVKFEPNFGSIFPGDRLKIQMTVVFHERGCHEVSIQYSVRRNNKNNELIPMDEPLEICILKYFCHLPVIKIEDLLHCGLGNDISKYVLWRLLNIDKLNQILNDLEVDRSDDLKMHVPPMIVQRESAVIKFLLSNPTAAHAKWSLRQIKNCGCPKVRVKLTISNKYNCPHRRLTNFEPQSGVIEAGEKIVVSMELNYELLGRTDLKWDLQLEHGRHIFLTIDITCLSRLEKKAFPLYGNIFELENIYIGDQHVTKQIYWIYNPTKHDVSYSLNTKPMKKFNENYNSEIFNCPHATGIIQQFSFQPIFIEFQPRRLGTFEVIVPLKLNNETRKIIIRGEGTNDSLTRINEMTIPRHDLFQITETPVDFNMNIINLPLMPLHSRTTRLIMINNRLEHELLAYKWKKYEIPGILEIDLEPIKGRIQPNSLQTCRLTVTSGRKSCIVDANVTCEFINQSKKRAYERSVMMQKKMCEEMKNYFTITEKGTTFQTPDNIIIEEPSPFYKVLTVRCHIYGPQDEKIKMIFSDSLKNNPPNEKFLDREKVKLCVPRENRFLVNFIIENMIWDILQSGAICDHPKSNLKYCQIALSPVERERVQKRSYIMPSGKIVEKILDNMIFMIVHKEFSLDMTHLINKSDVRQAAYPKIWQQVPGQERRLEQSPEMQ